MRAAGGLALGSMLALAGCGHAPAPEAYAPARDFACGPLIGDWAVEPADLAWLVPRADLPEGTRFAFLSVEDDADGVLRMVLRRPVDDVLAEATSLRDRRPDDYRIWRARTLDEPTPEVPAYYAVEESGPAVQIGMAPAFNECEDGWRHSLQPASARPAGDPPVNRSYTLAFALDASRNLLVQQRISTEHDTGFSFFDQHVTYFTYSHSEWHTLRAVPPSVARATVTAADLPPVPGPLERLEFDIARRKAINDIPLWLRDHVPAGNQITRVRELTYGPDASALPPNRMRFEVEGLHPLAIAEPFTAVLRRHAQVGDIEVREERAAPGNRRFVRIEFDFTLEPRSLR